MFHPLHTSIPNPPRFTYPFCYEPHPLCVIAAGEVQREIERTPLWRADADGGKMFGVLVAEDGEGRRGFLAAYSGLLCGRNDWPYFVPPVVDVLGEQGYFKQHEAAITAVNREIEAIEGSAAYQEAFCRLKAHRESADRETGLYRQTMARDKALRDAMRQQGGALTAEQQAAMVRQSQHQKATLKRLRQRLAAEEGQLRQALGAFDDKISALKDRRRHMSDHLQHWLFTQYTMLSATGRGRTLLSIFADTPQRVPPSGAGDCCAPKLLQHAYRTGLRPVCMAEFWWGRSPQGHVRHHLHYYPACSGKCKPILGHMLQGLQVDPNPHAGAAAPPHMDIVYEDRWLMVVNKPAGLPTVPGNSGAVSLLDMVRGHCPDATGPMIVHRLDMDTSGLLVIAKTQQVYAGLQRQFVQRTVVKGYEALVGGTVSPARGTVSLPLYSDPMCRPYQRVDHSLGKHALTEYEVTGSDGHTTRLRLWPHTGRTHQLRVHCAHSLGLGTPILGDTLYGTLGKGSSPRLCLHAATLEFDHPVTHRRMLFTSKADF